MAASPIRCRVLYVEDNPADAQLLEAVLVGGQRLLELIVLDDGEKAIHFIDSKPFRPNVIVLDLGIPKVDGLTVLARLKADASLQTVPVLVFVTPDSPNSRRADALNADLCLPKPLDLDGYRRVGTAILDLCRVDSEPSTTRP